MQILRQVRLPVTPAEAFAWHERPGALQRLMPPWESVRVIVRGTGIRPGTQVEVVNRVGPLRLRLVAEHRDYEPGRLFRDVSLHSPLLAWDHNHRFEADGSDGTLLIDDLEIRPFGGRLGEWLLGGFIRRKLDRMFTYRHVTTAADLALHAHYPANSSEKSCMNVAITGAGGLVGSNLIPLLTTGGHRVTRLVRRAAGEGEIAWNPTAATFDAGPLDGIDAVVHLAGENIAGRRWTPAFKARIRDSRIGPTRALCEGLARMKSPPRVLVAASAIGIYGDRGDEPLSEDSSPGTTFLSELVRDWEAATRPAVEAGIRVVNLRFGVILSPRDGALAEMLLPFKLGAGGVIAGGRQFMSWISIDDASGAIYHALRTDAIRGPVNAVAPHPVTNREFTKTLGRVLRRPTIFPMPAFAARLAFGEMANELLIGGANVQPRQLLATGYPFRHETLESALRHLLGR